MEIFTNFRVKFHISCIYVLFLMTSNILASEEYQQKSPSEIIPKFVSKEKLLFINSDFEMGDLTNWRSFGNAFLNQPTLGDNTYPREKNKVMPKGNWWVGTFENYQGLPTQKPGDAQKNEPTGELISTTFTIDTPYIGFLISGGSKKTTAVRLIIDGEIVRESVGMNQPLMRREFWDVREFAGKPAIISVVDREKGPWGCINVDDFRGYYSPINMLLFPNSDFEFGDLTNWKAEGTAFEKQPTFGDNPAVREGNKHSNHQGNYWIGTYELYQGKPGEIPGTVRRDVAFGTLRSTSFKIRGPFIAFLLGGGKGVGLEVRLYVDGNIVRTASNSSNREDMRIQIWNVEEFKDKDAELEIIDDSMDAWGHINVDYFRYLRLFEDM
ncbi:MAG: hypothetical protein N3G21_04640 [Candidatus Hydrogenedentes bacterium]|nr:hypothetical protein [Candidatus Hydrogenedentota bacterium]